MKFVTGVRALALVAMTVSAEKPAPVITPPRVIEKPEPEYTQEARAARIEGIVVLQGELTETGSLTGIRVIRRLGYGLDESALRCAEQWRFKPSTRDGVPIRTSVRSEVNFRLPPAR